LADWLHTVGCPHVAMESTGVYWRPIYNLLEGLFTLLVVNAQHMKAVPGRKTDVKDADVGQRVEVQWGPEGMVHIYHRGTLIVHHPRPSSQHQQCVDASHSQLFNWTV
jgi:hypothetical protein